MSQEVAETLLYNIDNDDSKSVNLRRLYVTRDEFNQTKYRANCSYYYIMVGMILNIILGILLYLLEVSIQNNNK